MSDYRFGTLLERRERREARERDAAFDERARDMRPTVGMALGTERVSLPVEMAAAKLGWVYFIQASCGSIKIGRARNVLYRLNELQCGHPQELKLLAVALDGRRETEYHRLFAEHRTRGEWFDPHADILSEIERLKVSE